jgi:hypothetical protein
MANATRTVEVYLTVQALASLPGPIIPHYATTLDVPRVWQWIPGSQVTADGYEVLGHVGGSGGRWHMLHEDDRGDDLPNTDATIYLSEKPVRYLPAGTLAANHVLTVATTTNSDGSAKTCEPGSRMTITRLDTEAFTYRIDCAVNGVLITLPASEAWFVDLRFDGSGWSLLRAGKMTP